MELSVKKNPRKGSLENIDDFGSPPPGISLTTDNKSGTGETHHKT